MREITIKIEVDWPDYEDVNPELILEDAIQIIKERVSYEIIEDKQL